MRLRLRILSPLDADEEIAAVARIVNGVEDGWHEWIEPDPGDPRLDAYYAQNPTHRELLSKSFTAAVAYGSPKSRTVVVAAYDDGSAIDCTWPLDEAVLYLAQPLEVLVENARNDGHFFTACWTALAQQVVQRLTSKRPGAFFSQGGGKAEVLQLIRHRTQEALDRRSVPPRMLVLLDSDARYPGHTTTESRQLAEACMELGIPIALLQKRAIENYVGADALIDLAATHPDVWPSVNFLVALTSEQRDHYPIKQGFDGPFDSPVITSDGEKALYAGVSWPVAFRPKLGRLMEHVLAHDALITRPDLAARGAVQELEALASRIDEEI